MSAEEQIAAPSVGENPEVLADQPTSMVTDEDLNNGATVRKSHAQVLLATNEVTSIRVQRCADRDQS